MSNSLLWGENATYHNVSFIHVTIEPYAVKAVKKLIVIDILLISIRYSGCTRLHLLYK